MNTGCKDCRWLDRNVYAGREGGVYPDCVHTSCFGFDPLLGDRNRRISSFDIKNENGDCQDFVRRKEYEVSTS